MVNVSLLRTQQQRLAAMNACSVLFRHQNLLRHVLKHHTLGSSPSLEVLNEGEELDTLSETLLIQKLIAKATQPSPLKAIFGKSDIEVNLVLSCSYTILDSECPVICVRRIFVSFPLPFHQFLILLTTILHCFLLLFLPCVHFLILVAIVLLLLLPLLSNISPSS